LLFRLKDDERLKACFKQLQASMDPQDIIAHVAFHRLQSQALSRRGRLQGAIRALHAAIRLTPTDPTLYDALAVALDTRGDDRGARKARQRAAECR
jgi:Flp pilus assembly protein TadD